MERLAEILDRYRHCAFSHVRRRANQVADKLANQGVKENDNLTFCSWPPQGEPEWASHVSRIATADKQSHEERVRHLVQQETEHILQVTTGLNETTI